MKKKIGKVILYLVLLLSFHLSIAQHGDTLRTADSTLYLLSHSSTGIINYTNISRSYLLNNLFKFNIIRKRLSFNTANSWVYGSQLTGITNNDYNSYADLDYLKAVQRFYYWGLLNYDKSYSLRIYDRLQTGAGVGYSVLTNPKYSLVLSDGFLYEYVHLYDIPEFYNTPYYSTVRNSLRIKYHVEIGKILVFDGMNFWQPSLLSKEDYIVKLNNSLSLKIKRWLSFTVATTYNKLNISKTENFLCTIGLTFQKTFVVKK
ncbi:MAG TPA: DUF481 domain-containing protein [Cytophagaceae bacterium]|nr:DUF481 domain-containing protein [Cytophagaceae bacterium]